MQQPLSRRLIRSMRHIQTVALDLFEAEGYAAVTIEQVAEAAEVSAPTIYRQFGSKERLVQWDEYDPFLLASIAQRIGTEPPIRAIRDGLVSALDSFSAAEIDRLLRRIRLHAANPELRAANAGDIDKLRLDLTELLEGSSGIGGAFDAAILAAATVGIFRVIVEEWLRTGGTTSLRAIFDEAFERLARLVSQS